MRVLVSSPLRLPVQMTEEVVSTPQKSSTKVFTPVKGTPGQHTLKRNELRAQTAGILASEAAEWLNKLVPDDTHRAVPAPPEQFLESIEDGVLLCKALMKLDDSIKISFKEDAKQGSFQARDNLANYLQGLRQLGLKEEVLFTVVDLIEKKTEVLYQHHVATSVLEFARVAEEKFGVSAPAVVKFLNDDKIDPEALIAAKEEQRKREEEQALLKAQKEAEEAEKRAQEQAAFAKREEERKEREAREKEAELKEKLERERIIKEREDRLARRAAAAARGPAKAIGPPSSERFEFTSTQDLFNLRIGTSGRRYIEVIHEIFAEAFPVVEEGEGHEVKRRGPPRFASAEEEQQWMEQVLGFHEANDTFWLLLWDRRSGSPTRTLIGFVMLVPYHDSLYCANLAIEQGHRRQGLGTAILHEAQDEAARRSLFALTGTVVSTSPHLLAYYTRLGAKVDQSSTPLRTGLVPPSPASAAVAAPSVRLRKEFCVDPSSGRIPDGERAAGYTRARDVRYSAAWQRKEAEEEGKWRMVHGLLPLALALTWVYKG